ncbi:hypothetical protein [Albimonas pacifica]|uniref:Aminoglycoside phosphotransferase family enzyme n=1 Tax=Albimonas pacifica TaxID=1114924 RepID=A0A1I3IYK5_9RHOB|nr:hypothetical protein [Albimonas pacifica]SFI53059.1 Aminoglycoside phosphotransferase family enzyme [Albimonas pacifica]
MSVPHPVPATGCAAASAAAEAPSAFLLRGGPWPDQPPPTCIETHASWVVLTLDRAWKLKKPVRLRHVDLRSLAERERLCREELRLNRELAGPDVYLGLAPLVRRKDGSLALGAPGRTVDWVIEMARLPAEAMLDRRLADGPPPPCEAIEAVCDVMLDFYASRPPPLDAGPARLNRLLREAQANAARLPEMEGVLGGALRADLTGFALAGLDDRRAEILRRGAEGLIVEGHGDLRAEHVCLLDPPVIFDRVEFDHGLRWVDPYDEFEALGLDCQAAGHGWIRAVLLARLARAGAPAPSPRLLAIYGVNRCLTRARLAIDHLRDARVRTPEKWPAQARRALTLAAALVDQAPD